jgi:hypothetical protein
MTFERVRLLLLGMGGVLLAAAGLWIALTPGELSSRFWGAFGVIFFGAATVVTWRLALKGQSLPRQTGRSFRFQQLIVPGILIFTLPWGLKLWFCLPLLVAWGVLLPQYRDRRALYAAAVFAALIAIAQALLFCLGSVAGIQEAQGAGSVALHVFFLLMVLWLDGRLLWEVRDRLGFARSAGVR